MKSETFDKILDSLIDEALPIVESMPDKNLPEEKDVVFSKEFEERMDKLFAKERKKRKRKAAAKCLRYIAASIAVVLVISGTTVMSVDALRVKVMNFIFNTHETNTEISVDEEANDFDAYEISLGYIPDGFKLKENRSTDGILYLHYECDDEYFYVNVQNVNGVVSINTEDAYVENITLNGMEAIYSENDTVKTLVFHNEKKMYSIMGTISKDELIKISDNLKNLE